MSCIACVCRCFFSSPHDVSKDMDFERESYLTINPVENFIYWAYAEVFDVRFPDDYFDIIDGYLVLFDEKCFFISCSKCLVQVKLRVWQLKRFENGSTTSVFISSSPIWMKDLPKKFVGNIFIIFETFPGSVYFDILAISKAN